MKPIITDSKAIGSKANGVEETLIELSVKLDDLLVRSNIPSLRPDEIAEWLAEFNLELDGIGKALGYPDNKDFLTKHLEI